MVMFFFALQMWCDRPNLPLAVELIVSKGKGTCNFLGTKGPFSLANSQIMVDIGGGRIMKSDAHWNEF